MPDELNNSRSDYLESVNYVGSTIKNGPRNKLQISWDDEDGFVMLFTPDMADTGNHYHVALNHAEAVQLSEFLTKKLEEIE